MQIKSLPNLKNSPSLSFSRHLFFDWTYISYCFYTHSRFCIAKNDQVYRLTGELGLLKMNPYWRTPFQSHPKGSHRYYVKAMIFRWYSSRHSKGSYGHPSDYHRRTSNEIYMWKVENTCLSTPLLILDCPDAPSLVELTYMKGLKLLSSRGKCRYTLFTFLDVGLSKTCPKRVFAFRSGAPFRWSV